MCRTSFNEAATIQSRKEEQAIARRIQAAEFNEAATIQSRKEGLALPMFNSEVRKFNEAATIQSRKEALPLNYREGDCGVQ